MTALVGKTDETLSNLSEQLARKLTRRQVIFRGAKGLATATAAFSVGSLIHAKDAFAACECSPPGDRALYCTDIGYPCPSDGCPIGCYLCYDYACPDCPYPGGYWVACNCGSCNMGYRLCYDCACPGCGYWECGCKSVCLCSGCCSRQQVLEEMKSHQKILEEMKQRSHSDAIGAAG